MIALKWVVHHNLFFKHEVEITAGTRSGANVLKEEGMWHWPPPPRSDTPLDSTQESGGEREKAGFVLQNLYAVLVVALFITRVRACARIMYALCENNYSWVNSPRVHELLKFLSTTL